MEKKRDEVVFRTEDGEKITFVVLEQTKLGGIDYLLVTSSEDNEDEDYEDEAEALILKDISKPTDEEAIYDVVEDDQELQLLAGIFRELVEDIELY